MLSNYLTCLWFNGVNTLYSFHACRFRLSSYSQLRKKLLRTIEKYYPSKIKWINWGTRVFLLHRCSTQCAKIKSMVNHFLSAVFLLRNTYNTTGYCYQLVNIISFHPSKIDYIKRLYMKSEKLPTACIVNKLVSKLVIGA
jgi:hypothetical protein